MIRIAIFLMLQLNVFANKDKIDAIERYKSNMNLCAKYSHDLNKPEIFDPILDYVNDKNPWWTYEKIVAGIKEKKLIDKNELTKNVVSKPEEFLVYYDKGGLHAVASFEPLEVNVSDEQVRLFLLEEVKKRVTKELDGLCSDSLQEYCEGYMDCANIQEYYEELSSKFDKYPKEKELFESYYNKEANKSFGLYQEKVWEAIQKFQPFPHMDLVLTYDDVKQYVAECKKRVQ